MKKLPQINKFYKVSLAVFLLLWAVRMVFPSVLNHREPEEPEPPMPPVVVVEDEGLLKQATNSLPHPGKSDDKPEKVEAETPTHAAPIRAVGKSDMPHPIRGVRSYDESFPDVQEVQIQAAQQWGVTPPRNRQEAEQRKDELVYVGSSPYYHLDPTMTSSIPYLVPRAAMMLQRIGSNFYDSLYVKGLPLHKIIVSSVLRSDEDVEKLTVDNVNANRQSCHRYGTTVDICYTRFHRVVRPGSPASDPVRDDTLKWVLSEVLRDLREEGACYVKHEVRQSCFHITVR